LALFRFKLGPGKPGLHSRRVWIVSYLVGHPHPVTCESDQYPFAESAPPIPAQIAMVGKSRLCRTSSDQAHRDCQSQPGRHQLTNILWLTIAHQQSMCDFSHLHVSMPGRWSPLVLLRNASRVNQERPYSSPTRPRTTHLCTGCVPVYHRSRTGSIAGWACLRKEQVRENPVYTRGGLPYTETTRSAAACVCKIKTIR